MVRILIVLEKIFLKSLLKIDYDNLFFKIDDHFLVKSIGFLKEVGALYDLFIYLLGNAKRVLNSTEIQIHLFKAINVLHTHISSMKNDATDQSEEQKKEIFAKQESVLNNAEVFLKKDKRKLTNLQKTI